MMSEAVTHEAETERLAQALRNADAQCNRLQADVAQLTEQLSTAADIAAKERSEVRWFIVFQRMCLEQACCVKHSRAFVL